MTRRQLFGFLAFAPLAPGLAKGTRTITVSASGTVSPDAVAAAVMRAVKSACEQADAKYYTGKSSPELLLPPSIT